MKWVDAADFTEIVLRGMCMELVERKRLFALEQFELILMDFNHKRILPSTDGTVTRRELRKVCSNGEDHSFAVATSGIS
jgi:hypothetical protein